MSNNDVVAETIKVYEETAQNYCKNNFAMKKRVRDLADFFIRNLHGRKILDIGCGPGRDAKYFCGRGLEVTGIDLTLNFIKIASVDVPEAEFLPMDMRQLDFLENSFDGIWLDASFIHVPKKEARKTLVGFKKVLKPDGLMFISGKVGTGEKFVQKTDDCGRARFFVFYPETEFKDLIELSGFSLLKTTIDKDEDGNNVWINIFAIKN
jgi:ubiquinone/menaquinone biosynthesis C-methylase UbiE